MNIKIPVREEEYFHKLLTILNDIPPFNKIRPKELKLYAYILELNYKYRYLPFKERNTQIFHYDRRIELADKMGVQVSGIYNLMKGLRKAGLITKRGMVPKYVLPKTKEVTFKFIEEE